MEKPDEKRDEKKEAVKPTKGIEGAENDEERKDEEISKETVEVLIPATIEQMKSIVGNVRLIIEKRYQRKIIKISPTKKLE